MSSASGLIYNNPYNEGICGGIFRSTTPPPPLDDLFGDQSQVLTLDPALTYVVEKVAKAVEQPLLHLCTSCKKANVLQVAALCEACKEEKFKLEEVKKNFPIASEWSLEEDEFKKLNHQPQINPSLSCNEDEINAIPKRVLGCLFCGKKDTPQWYYGPTGQEKTLCKPCDEKCSKEEVRWFNTANSLIALSNVKAKNVQPLSNLDSRKEPSKRRRNGRDQSCQNVRPQLSIKEAIAIRKAMAIDNLL